MKPNIKLVKNEKLKYRYSNIMGLFNLHYNIVTVTNLRIIMTYAYKPWWYFLFFNLKPNEISNISIFIKYISSLKLKTKSVYTTSYTGPFQFIFSKRLRKTDTEHSVKSFKYLPKRYSFDEIIFNAAFRGMFLASVITAALWKIFNVSKKILLIQALLCIIINLIYDITSYSPIKYLEVYTLDDVGDEDTFSYDSNSYNYKYKRPNNCGVYRSKNNSYIIEGDIMELKFLRDKIAAVIQERTIKTELLMTDNLENNENLYKINKDLTNLAKEIDADLKNIKKKKKTKLNKKDLNSMEKSKNKTNPKNKNKGFKNRMKRILLNKHEQIEIDSIEKEKNRNIKHKTSLFNNLFGYIITFIRIIIIGYISTILLLSIVYHSTKLLERMTIK